MLLKIQHGGQLQSGKYKKNMISLKHLDLFQQNFSELMHNCPP